jgi:hypothetical protein
VPSVEVVLCPNRGPVCTGSPGQAAVKPGDDNDRIQALDTEC